MESNQPPNVWFAQQLEPWFPVFGLVAQAGHRDHLAALSILGLPRKTERANEYHRVFRKHFHHVDDEAAGLMRLVEEPDGDGLDYLVCRMDPDNHFGVRWGRYKDGLIKRNHTDRSRSIQSQGHLWLDSADDEQELPMVSVGYVLADDYTLAGQPCWWINRLVLLRERAGRSEFITEVAVFQQPETGSPEVEDLGPLIEARNSDHANISSIIQQIRLDAA